MEGQKLGNAVQSKKNPFLNEDMTINVTHSSVDSPPIREDQTNLLVKVIDLHSFKTQPCQSNLNHNIKRCQYFHSWQDKRRVGVNYSPLLCRKVSEYGGICELCDSCPYAHNMVEVDYHSCKYKKKYCVMKQVYLK